MQGEDDKRTLAMRHGNDLSLAKRRGQRRYPDVYGGLRFPLLCIGRWPASPVEWGTEAFIASVGEKGRKPLNVIHVELVEELLLHLRLLQRSPALPLVDASTIGRPTTEVLTELEEVSGALSVSTGCCSCRFPLTPT